MLTGAFLAEAAATVDNKLNVQGGVLSKFTVGPDRVARVVLVVLTLPDGEDSELRVDVEMKPPTLDASQHTSFDAPRVSVGEFPGFAFFPLETRLPFDGRWVIEVSCGDSLISLPLVIDEWSPQSLGI
ncbi:hypothetical protein A5787_03180 [Mycobacterium sp. 852002-50816_SCH5313054-b]|uniref:hypothetical protein n=1 Tax=Mycobacterium sp. 852002-50816_SCH5313054-b TaxID=1834092 RepID=UPI0008019CA4|nr:hypothetical protein [Mycobacterium sp. 852002-50816_SCH5313054-b]OBF55737.1 hypothetical protein A5787_03180 [Mycobacterium sp. 852002-50816_SCH5313054-b]